MGSHHPRYNVVSWRWLHCYKSSKFNAEHDTSNLTWYFAIEVSNSTIQLHTHVFYLHFSFSFIFIFRFGFFLTLLYNYYCVLEKRGTFILPRILPESPRWILLHSASSRSTSEAQGLLERAVTEDQRQTSKYRDFLSLWEKFYLPPKSGGTGCFTFLRLKEPRKTTIVLGFAWWVRERQFCTDTFTVYSRFY